MEIIVYVFAVIGAITVGRLYIKAIWHVMDTLVEKCNENRMGGGPAPGVAERHP